MHHEQSNLKFTPRSHQYATSKFQSSRTQSDVCTYGYQFSAASPEIVKPNILLKPGEVKNSRVGENPRELISRNRAKTGLKVKTLQRGS